MCKGFSRSDNVKFHFRIKKSFAIESLFFTILKFSYGTSRDQISFRLGWECISVVELFFPSIHRGLSSVSSTAKQ